MGERDGFKDSVFFNDERIGWDRNKKRGLEVRGGEGLVILGILKCCGLIEFRISKLRC